MSLWRVYTSMYAEIGRSLLGFAFLILVAAFAAGRACDAARPWADQYHPRENLAVPGFSISQVTGFAPGQQARAWRVEEISSSEPANVFYRGQVCRMTFQFANRTNKAINTHATLEVVHYRFTQPRADEFSGGGSQLGRGGSCSDPCVAAAARF